MLLQRRGVEQVGHVAIVGHQVAVVLLLQRFVPLPQVRQEPGEPEQPVDARFRLEGPEVVVVRRIRHAGRHRHLLRGVGGDHGVVVPHRHRVDLPRVVVAVLGAAELVARDEHRHPARQVQDGQEVADPLPPQLPRPPGVPRQVIVRAAVGGAERVGLAVVLLLIADQVGHVEAVVGVYEIDGLLGSAVVGEVLVVTVYDIQELDGVAIALGETTYRVTVATIPLGPALREVSDLVSPQVPCLRDDLDVLFLGKLGDGCQQRMVGEEAFLVVPVLAVGVVRFAAEHRRQVEPESVDPHLDGPVFERVEHQLLGHG